MSTTIVHVKRFAEAFCLTIFCFRSTRENPNTDHMDVHLQTLFDHLKEKTGETFGVTRKLGVHRGTEMNNVFVDLPHKCQYVVNMQSSEIYLSH